MVKIPVFALARECWSDLISQKALAAFTVGSTTGLALLTTHIAFATVIYSGDLAAYASQGVGLVLFGCFAACLVTGLASGYRGTIAGLSPSLVIGMAVIASTMAASDETLFPSVVAALILCAVLTGICCLVVGRFRLANLVRFIPYPVASGFVAGIGGAVCLAALSVMGADPDWRSVSAFLESVAPHRWAPGVAYGIVLYWAMKRWRNPLILPISVALAIGVCHLALALLDISNSEAREAGLLSAGTGGGSLWPALSPSDLMSADWAAIANQIPNMLVLIAVALIAVVLNIAGLEMAAKQELDWDREFAASGIASIASGLGGGTVATIAVPPSLRSKLLGATTRLTGIISALIVASALFMGDSLLNVVPTGLIGGILVFAGVGMLDESLVKAYGRLPRADFGIIALIFIAIVGFGLLEGMGAGMLATLVFFAVRLSRVDPIESRYNIRDNRSSKSRSVPDRAILMEEGDRALGYRLRGYIFFGSVSPLAIQLRESVHSSVRPVCLILDFSAVSGIDYSAANVLCRFVETAHSARVQMVACSLPGYLMRVFKRNLPSAVFDKLAVEPNEDRAIERCEEIVIASWKEKKGLSDEQRAQLLEHAADHLERHLDRQIKFEELLEELDDWLDSRDHADGEILDDALAPREGLQLLVSGRASAHDVDGARLYQCGPGDPVRSWAPMAEKVALVRADEPSRTVTMTPKARRWLESHRQDLALKLYGFLLANQLQPERGIESK